ncbi:MAG TPA: DUF4157 domain-containing protein, partial [Anaerolineae bacterium]
ESRKPGPVNTETLVAEPNTAAIVQQAMYGASGPPADTILQLQHTIGNRAVGQLLTRQHVAIQAKLTVGAADDPFEREADRVAAQVISRHEAPAGVGLNEDDTSVQRSPAITPFVQRRNADVNSSFDAGQDIERQLAVNKTGGTQLSAKLRSELEPRFGADFSKVKVHTGSASHQLNRLLSAEAFTYGSHIYLGAGHENKDSGSSQKLVAHELTHVVQQTGRVALRKPSPAQVMTSVPAQATIQRKSSTGLASKSATNDFAKAAFATWKDPANKDKPLKELTDSLMGTINATLTYPCLFAYGASGNDTGSFSRVTWTINFNPGAFSRRPGVTKIGELNQSEVAEIVDTTYHESRHSEQYFRIARMQAGQGKTASEIETGMSIPADVAAAAFANPLKDEKGNKTLISEAKGWEAITVGKYGAYKGEVNQIDDEADRITAVFEPSDDDATQIANLAAPIATVKARVDRFFIPEQAKIEKIKKKDSIDVAVLKHVKAITTGFTKLNTEYTIQKSDSKKYNLSKLQKLATTLNKSTYNAYRSHQHEQDAWAVGEAVAKAFKSQKPKK